MMAVKYVFRRTFTKTSPFLEAVRSQADSEREALGFLPAPTYADAAHQGKLLVLAAHTDAGLQYVGHLLFGGIFPHLTVRQICVSPKWRQQGNATKLLRTLKARGEAEGYLSIVANVASDLKSANAFYERNGFTTQRLKSGGLARRRIINVKTLQLDTPNLFSAMSGTVSPRIQSEAVRKRTLDVPVYAIDLNVFFDAIKKRPRSKDAGALFKAALEHQIRMVASYEFVRELERTSSDARADPVLSLAKQIPVLPSEDKGAIEALVPLVTECIFPNGGKALTSNDRSDVRHVCHAIAAAAAGYITSDTKVLAARDELMSRFALDVIALSEFVELLSLPTAAGSNVFKATEHLSISTSKGPEIDTLLRGENVAAVDFLGVDPDKCISVCVSDSDGLVGVGLLRPMPPVETPSRLLVCVRQNHPYSSTVADFLISEHVRACASKSACTIEMLDIAHHPITRRIALSRGFRKISGKTGSLSKVALGEPITQDSWRAARLRIERLSGLVLQKSPPTYEQPTLELGTEDGKRHRIPLFELESLLSPTVFALPKRHAVIVPITKDFAAALLETEAQLSFLDVPEAQFLSRRTYFNTIRAAGAMTPGAAICFYESVRSGGRGSIVAIGRIVDVMAVPTSEVPEALRRGAVVENLGQISKASRVLATTIDNLLPLPHPVTLRRIKDFGCVTGANLVTATRISAKQLEEIVLAGFSHAR